jgi:hypothetical protein
LGRQLLLRLRAECERFGGNSAIDDAMRAPTRGDARRSFRTFPQKPTARLPIIVRVGDTTLRFVSTIAHVRTAEDIAIADWRKELMSPADNDTRERLHLASI